MSRTERFLADCDAVCQSRSSDEQFRNLCAPTDSLEMNFELHDDDGWQRVSIVANEDYPENTMTVVGDEAPLISRVTVAAAVDRLCARVHSEGSEEPHSFTGVSGADDEQVIDLASESEGEEDMVDLDDVLPVVQECQVLRRDIAAVHARQHCDVYEHHLERIDYGEVFLRVAIRGLSKITLDAWQLPEDEPLAVELSRVSFHDYRLSSDYPRVRVFLQSDPDRKFAVGKQLELILGRYLVQHWRVKSEAEMKRSKPFLVELIDYVVERLRNISDHCIICDRRHEMGGLLMPVVCLDTLCVFAYDELGLMADVCSLRVNPDVVDLLLALLRWAALSAREELVLDPYPSVRDPTSSERMLLSADARDPDRLRASLEQLSCRKRWFVGGGGGGEDGALRDGLLRWVISSNRTYLHKLKDDQLMDEFKPAHQYLMITDSPEKEAAFVAAKKQHGGSTFFFHGSPMENWHSILRKGLINASGTKYQMHGAVHGSGIYLSSNMAMSMGYSARSSGGPPTYGKSCETEECCVKDANLLQTPSLCIAVCEVVNSAELRASGEILVLTNPTHCCTRFLFVFESAQTGARVNQLPQPTVDRMRSLIDTYRESHD